MRGFFRSNTFKILLIAVITFSAILTLSNTVGETSLASVFGMVSNPMQEVSADLSQDLTGKYDNMTKEELEAYTQTLVEENAILRNQLVEYYTLKDENKSYKEALNILIKRPEFELMPAMVVAKDVSNPFKSFSIDKGYVDGISVNDSVITSQGLVGIVTEVYAMSSRVTTILSESVSVAAIARDANESGVVSGNASFSVDGLVKLEYLTNKTKVKEGSIIVTSGSSGIFPEDIIIGKVSSLEQSEKDVSFYAVVKPYEDINNLSNVFVITNFPGKNQQEDVS